MKKNKLWNKFRGGLTIDMIETCNSCRLQNNCSLRNCRLKPYFQEGNLYSKPNDCLMDKFVIYEDKQDNLALSIPR